MWDVWSEANGSGDDRNLLNVTLSRVPCHVHLQEQLYLPAPGHNIEYLPYN
jgi:hypothetical protein